MLYSKVKMVALGESKKEDLKIPQRIAVNYIGAVDACELEIKQCWHENFSLVCFINREDNITYYVNNIHNTNSKYAPIEISELLLLHNTIESLKED